MIAKQPTSLNFAVLIFAWNEEQVIGDTIWNLREALRESDALYVIADNCTDNTIGIARTSGAITVTRNSGKRRGKGAALSWFMKAYRRQMLEFNYILILDADSKVPGDLFEKLSQQISKDTQAAQCFLSPDGYIDHPLSTVISLSEIIEQTVFDRIRSVLGFSVRLRGTGMLFRPQILIKLCPGIGTEVEDIALSLLLADKKILVKQFNQVTIFDPKPVESTAASRQRARWFRGQWKALKDYLPIVVRLFLSGFRGWSVLGSLFLKPRWLKLLILIIAGLALLRHPIFAAIFLSIAVIDILMILIGIIALPNRTTFLRSLLYLPVFIVMWIKGIILSFKHRPWQRVRENKEESYTTAFSRHP